MVNRDIVVTKIAHIQENLNRLKRKNNIAREQFLDDRDVQDIVLYNLQTAIQGCIDIAGHIISDNNWGIPESFADMFDKLCEQKVISRRTTEAMRAMAGLRNLIAHEYATLDLGRIHQFYTSQVNDFYDFLKEISQYIG